MVEMNWWWCTYNLAFFLGPGLPLTFGIGSPSGPNATAALRLVPFFLVPSMGGGGMADGTGVPTATGVSTFDSDLASPFELVAAGRVLEFEVEGDSLTGDSSFLTSSLTGRGSKVRSFAGDSFNWTMRVGFMLDDFRRAAEAPESFGGIVMKFDGRRKLRCAGREGSTISLRVSGFGVKAFHEGVLVPEVLYS